MILYELHYKMTDWQVLLHKTQRYLKDGTTEHVRDVWKIIETGCNTYGDAWYGSSEYKVKESTSNYVENATTIMKSEPRSNQSWFRQSFGKETEYHAIKICMMES